MTARRIIWVIAAGCGAAPAPPVPPGAATAQLSLAAEDRMLVVPEGQYIAGSTPEERAAAYDDFLATASVDTARANGWFDHEEDRHVANLPAFRIDLLPVTQGQYAEFVRTGAAPAPAIDEPAWRAQGLAQDYKTEVARFVWTDGQPPSERMDHPVVLVTWREAGAYCAWRGELAGHPRRLPTAAEFEKAARGDGGLAYPWGNGYDPERLNSAVHGPRDTTPVGTHVTGASPYGVLEMAGNVFQWTSTPGEPGTMLVKGSAWDDFAGVGRAASAHPRKLEIRHVLVGFRCAGAP